SGVRPYRTILSGIDPIEARCDCPDFVKNSLAVCKHILIVLEHLHVKPRLLQQALKEQERLRASFSTGLHWDPIRPLTGIGDWLERVDWVLGPETNASVARPGRAAQALKWFRRGASGVLALKQSFRDDPPKRLALVEDLLKLHASGARTLRHD